MLLPLAGQSKFGLSVGLLGWLMTSSFLCAQTALQTQGQSTPTVRGAATAFRVDTDLYLQSNSNKPDKQTLTLFKDGIYYDFPMDDEKQSITMTDPARGRIIMLSPSRQIKTVFKTAELTARMEAVKRDMSTSKELVKMLSPEVTASENMLRVGDESFAYQATLQMARDASMANQYADFADWSARLNAILPPNFFPPFVRMTLNQELASRGALPDTIERITRHNNKSSVIRSKLLVIASLSTDDEAKIRLVGEMLSTCKEVSQADFFSSEVARSTSPRASIK